MLRGGTDSIEVDVRISHGDREGRLKIMLDSASHLRQDDRDARISRGYLIDKNGVRKIQLPWNRGCESQGLWRVRQAARRDRRTRFTALLHHVTPELHRASYWELNHKAVPGIEGETWTEYRKPVVARSEDLHERVQRGTYRAKPSKRAWIAKTGGQRPLGIAVLEDKIVQQAVRRVLEEILEVEFVGLS